MHKRFMKTAALIAAVMMTAALPLSVQPESWLGKPLTAYADEESYTYESSNGMEYKKYSDHIEISSVDMKASEIKIPAEIGGLPVTKIGIYTGGFSEMKTLTLPDTLKEIGPYAFNYCKNLTSVTLPDSIELVDFRAFESCTALAEINFPDHLVKTSSYTFDNTPWLDAQRKKNPLVIVNGALIDGRTAKGDVTVPSEVKYVAGGAFSKNNDLTSLVIPSSVSLIPDNLCWYCENLTAAELNGAEKLDFGVFAACNKLKDIKISGKLKTIDGYAFTDNTGTATITFYNTEDAWNNVEKPADDPFLKRAKLVFDPSGAPPDGPGDDPVQGDLNGDGKCSQEDAVQLLDWLLTKPNASLSNWEAADLNSDKKLDASDLSALKKLILTK